MKNGANYEKHVVNNIKTIRHIVRIRLNERASDVIQTLKNVPPNAIVAMVVDDNEIGGHGEIVFEEEKIKSL